MFEKMIGKVWFLVKKFLKWIIPKKVMVRWTANMVTVIGAEMITQMRKWDDKDA